MWPGNPQKYQNSYYLIWLGEYHGLFVGPLCARHKTLINAVLNIFGWTCTILSAFVTPKVGRRTVFLFSAVGINVAFIIWTVLTSQYDAHARLPYGIGVLGMIIVNNFFTCICWIPLVVAYPIETVTTKQRSIYFAITILSISETSFVPSYLTPVGIANIGWHYYIPTCLWNVVLVFILYFTFVETRSLTLEEIATLFDGHEDFDSNAIAVSHDMEMKTVELFTHYESVEHKISSEK
ncbi:hypothetical protein N7471_007115 [Penicillium samsonianum]|uniref:uncharacterized protein n=1 Tax=Penicillium samsonianum TaxID=1882272 RepID=UPI002549887A|nr:uncharacterized protein N7471_007115 [Penicillium samsonianum]KAJ6131900.1 hypothetical protein N7471_007115 [Penicillium samsonianum]